MAFTTLMVLAPGCRWMLRMTAGVSFIHAAWLVVLDAVHDLRNIAQHDRRAVAIGDHNLLIIVAGHQLIVGIDGVILMRSVEAALGLHSRLVSTSAVRRSSRLSPYDDSAVGLA